MQFGFLKDLFQASSNPWMIPQLKLEPFVRHKHLPNHYLLKNKNIKEQIVEKGPSR